MIENSVPSKASATCFWGGPSSDRCFLIGSPMVRGSKSLSFAVNDLSVTGRRGKKATQPCAFAYAVNWKSAGFAAKARQKNWMALFR